jgi:aromatic-L-amino-acid/L-tryptophan decarboxylase
MIDSDEFRKYAHEFVDWMADYLERVGEYPVKSPVKPGEIFQQIPDEPPVIGESMDDIFTDFQKIILPGMTHWQSPNYFAYFTANSSYPSILGEMLTSTMAAQCMNWETSPAAAELEEKVMNWLRDMIGLPEEFTGVIQDTASTATLVALLTARERFSQYRINDEGYGDHRFRIYCSMEAHSSIEKAVKMAGIGRENLVKIPVDDSLAIIPEKLQQAIDKDLRKGFEPLCVIAALGTTGTLAVDRLKPLTEICQKNKIWLHVDAAFAGTAQVLPEYRWMIDGIEDVDSYVFNPHKWMFTNFDCSAYFVKDSEALIRTFEILPEYLKTRTRGQVNDYRDWGVQLGRRFRALKLWFVIRDFGVEGIKEKVKQHLDWSGELAAKIEESSDFEMHRPQNLTLVCFRYRPEGISNPVDLNTLNEELMQKLNESGKIFITHTRVRGLVTLRMVVAQTRVTRDHVNRAWELIKETARELYNQK